MSKACLKGFSRINQQVLPFFIAILASAISTALTVRMCQELRGGDGELVAPAIGVCLEAAKYTFAVAGSALLFSAGRLVGRIGGLALCVLALILVGTSIAASLGYFLELDKQRQVETLKVSHRYRAAEAELALLDQQIALLSRTVTDDTEAHYRTRALATLGRVDELRQRRATVAASLSGLEIQPAQVQAESAYFGNLAAFLRLPSPLLRTAAYGLVALLLELVSVAAYLLARAQATTMLSATAAGAEGGGDNVVKRQQGQQRQQGIVASSRMSVVKRQRTAPTPATTTTAKTTSARPEGSVTAAERGDTGLWQHNLRYQMAKQLIAAGKLSPTARALKQQLTPLGDRTALRYLRSMVSEGVLTREGSRYRLAMQESALA